MGTTLVDSPELVIKGIERLQELSRGGFGGLLFRANEWATREQTLKSYELFARYVMPRFQHSLGTIADSNQWCRDNRRTIFGPNVQAIRKVHLPKPAVPRHRVHRVLAGRRLRHRRHGGLTTRAQRIVGATRIRQRAVEAAIPDLTAAGHVDPEQIVGDAGDDGELPRPLCSGDPLRDERSEQVVHGARRAVEPQLPQQLRAPDVGGRQDRLVAQPAGARAVTPSVMKSRRTRPPPQDEGCEGCQCRAVRHSIGITEGIIRSAHEEGKSPSHEDTGSSHSSRVVFLD
jgi:hypothetical protein